MVVTRSQLVVRMSGLAFVLLGLVIATWISRCLFDYGQFDFLVESGTAHLGKIVALAIAMIAFGVRVLIDGHRTARRLNTAQAFNMVTPEVVHQVRQMAKRGRQGDAVRYYRTVTGATRHDAVEAVRRLTKW